MIKYFAFVYFLVSICVARPNIDIDSRNVVTVPPNCPVGQEWVNGQCRDVWRIAKPEDGLRKDDPNVDLRNVVTVPPNCRPGQALINGQCRDIWKIQIDSRDVVTVPFNCKKGQEYTGGRCRDVWGKPNGDDDLDEEEYQELTVHCFNGQELVNGYCRDIWRIADYRNVITVPTNCPEGQQWVNGQCRDIWRIAADNRNVITVPPNCPGGQEWVNGQCRDIWRFSKLEPYFKNLRNVLSKGVRQANEPEIETNEATNRNVITVPSQCPNGYKPDALGYCRPIFGY